MGLNNCSFLVLLGREPSSPVLMGGVQAWHGASSPEVLDPAFRSGRESARGWTRTVQALADRPRSHAGPCLAWGPQPLPEQRTSRELLAALGFRPQDGCP